MLRVERILQGLAGGYLRSQFRGLCLRFLALLAQLLGLCLQRLGIAVVGFCRQAQLAYSLVANLLHQGEVGLLHRQLHLHLLDGQLVGHALRCRSRPYQAVGPLHLVASQPEVADGFLERALHAHLLSGQHVVPLYLQLLLDDACLLLDGLLYLIIHVAQVLHQRLLLLLVYHQRVGPVAQPLLAHLLLQVVEGQRIGMLSLGQQELQPLPLLAHQLCRVPRRTVLHHVGQQDVHLRQVLAQVGGDAVVGALLVDEFSDGVQVLHGDALQLRQVLLCLQVVAPYLRCQSLRPLAFYGSPRHFVEVAALLQFVPPQAELLHHFLLLLRGACRKRLAQLRPPLQVLLLQQFGLAVEQFLAHALFLTGFLQLLLAARVVAVQLGQRIVALAEAVLPAAPVLLVAPVSGVGREAFALQLVLYLLALCVIPVEHRFPVALQSVVQRLHQRLVLGQHGAHVGIGLQNVLELIHLVAPCHQLVHVEERVVGAVGGGVRAPCVAAARNWHGACAVGTLLSFLCHAEHTGTGLLVETGEHIVDSILECAILVFAEYLVGTAQFLAEVVEACHEGVHVLSHLAYLVVGELVVILCQLLQILQIGALVFHGSLYPFLVRLVHLHLIIVGSLCDVALTVDVGLCPVAEAVVCSTTPDVVQIVVKALVFRTSPGAHLYAVVLAACLCPDDITQGTAHGGFQFCLRAISAALCHAIDCRQREVARLGIRCYSGQHPAPLVHDTALCVAGYAAQFFLAVLRVFLDVVGILLIHGIVQGVQPLLFTLLFQGCNNQLVGTGHLLGSSLLVEHVAQIGAVLRVHFANQI